MSKMAGKKEIQGEKKKQGQGKIVLCGANAYEMKY